MATPITDSCVEIRIVKGRPREIVDVSQMRALEEKYNFLCSEFEALIPQLKGWLLANDSDSIIGSCNCLTKTPDIKFHKKGCKYRLIMERDAARKQLTLANISDSINHQ